MNSFLILICLQPILFFGQTNYSPSKVELTKAYTQAITDFIKAANKNNKTNFDTLYFGKRVNGEPDDFPEITLPSVIENTQIKLITLELATKKQSERTSNIYINLIGWVNKQNAEFMFVVFSNGFMHQYDYNINYKYDSKQKKLKLERLKFKAISMNK